MAARILKGCYFKDVEFLEAPKCPSGSFIWNSLVWGSDLLAKGLRWGVGDGASISIYNDRWIPRVSTFKVLSSPVLGGFFKVSQLFSPSGGWNLSYLEQNFCDDDYLAIISIPVASRSRGDFLLWHYESSGSYSMKNGYRVARSLVP